MPDDSILISLLLHNTIVICFIKVLFWLLDKVADLNFLIGPNFDEANLAGVAETWINCPRTVR